MHMHIEICVFEALILGIRFSIWHFFNSAGQNPLESTCCQNLTANGLTSLFFWKWDQTMTDSGFSKYLICAKRKQIGKLLRKGGETSTISKKYIQYKANTSSSWCFFIHVCI